MTGVFWQAPLLPDHQFAIIKFSCLRKKTNFLNVPWGIEENNHQSAKTGHRID
jgi:hypothetical protein